MAVKKKGMMDALNWLATVGDIDMWVLGKKVHPFKDPRMRRVAMAVYSIRDLMRAPTITSQFKVERESSLLPGEMVNRCIDILDTPEDWVEKVRIQRVLTQRCICILRCLQNDVYMGVYAGTWEADKKMGTDYHERFKEYIKVQQQEDNWMAGAVIDPKGDPLIPRHKQESSWVGGLRVVERKKDGIVVSGIKPHVTYGNCLEELFFTPGSDDFTEGDDDWAVCCALPLEHPGIKFICRPPGVKDRGKAECAFSGVFGWTDVTVVCDKVFVPNDRVFLAGKKGEWKFANKMFEYTLDYSHLWAKSGCTGGTTDLMIGLIALVTKNRGVFEEHRVKDALIEAIHEAELGYNAGIGAAVEGWKHPSGAWFPNKCSATAGKYLAYLQKDQTQKKLMELAGGCIVTGPTELEFYHEELGKYVQEAYRGAPGVDPEDRFKGTKAVEDLLVLEMGGLFRNLHINTGGPPWYQAKTMLKNYDIEDRLLTARVWAGIEKQDNIGFAIPEIPKLKDM